MSRYLRMRQTVTDSIGHPEKIGMYAVIDLSSNGIHEWRRVTPNSP